MDTEVTFDQRLALSSTSSGDAEEFSGHYNVDTAEQIQHASLDDHAKSSDATTDAQLLAEQFAGILYFATRAADDKVGRRSTYRRSTGSLYGAESVRQGPDAPDHRQSRVFDRVLKGSRRPSDADGDRGSRSGNRRRARSRSLSVVCRHGTDGGKSVQAGLVCPGRESAQRAGAEPGPRVASARRVSAIEGTKYDWVTFKTFRKAIATLLAKEYDLRTAREQLGYASQATTETLYVGLNSTAPEIAETLEKFLHESSPGVKDR